MVIYGRQEGYMKRKIDGLGRIVIPKEFRTELNIHIDEYLDMTVQDGKIILSVVDDKIECKKCKSLINVDANYCSYCGKKVR